MSLSYPSSPSNRSTLVLLALFLAMPALVCAASHPHVHPHAPPAPPRRRNTNYGYYIPANGGGSMLTSVPNTYPAGLGEPLNIIISAYSDSQILQNTVDDGGLVNYFQSFGFSTECLGQHSGDNQAANLGDGNGWLNETAVIRWDYGNATFGTCEETINGGDHFRYWIQNGADANSGAIFLAASYEMPIARAYLRLRIVLASRKLTYPLTSSEDHDIIVNGYDLGRDWLVGNATAQSVVISTAALTNTSTFSGQTSYGGYTYQTTVDYVSGLLQNSSDGINHAYTVAYNGSNAIDGLVAIMTVKLLTKPQSVASGAEWTSRPTHIWMLVVLTCSSLAVSLLL
ncbi:hypothetical protein ID866_7743 [Astraeus odoratus]|nr:hypothetical protein ID866_7743 [Astraeus odoratus]